MAAWTLAWDTGVLYIASPPTAATVPQVLQRCRCRLSPPVSDIVMVTRPASAQHCQFSDASRKIIVAKREITIARKAELSKEKVHRSDTTLSSTPPRRKLKPHATQTRKRCAVKKIRDHGLQWLVEFMLVHIASKYS